MNAATISKLTVFMLSTLSISNPAWAEGTRADRLQAQSQKLAAIEGQLHPEDLRALEYNLAGIDRILHRYQTGSQLTCLSNGQSGPYEKFVITEPTTGAAYGKATAFQTCKQLTVVQNQNLICVSNGEQGPYEKFGVYDYGRKLQKGGFTELKSCLALVSRARSSFVCQSNGQAGPYEKFRLYNRDTDKTLGGETQLEQCLGSIPN